MHQPNNYDVSPASKPISIALQLGTDGRTPDEAAAMSNRACGPG